MTARVRSLERLLLWRLGLVLSLAFFAVAGWLWFHLSSIESGHSQPIVHEVLTEFFTDIAWTVPIVLVITLMFTAITLRRSFAPLRELSVQAGNIRPGSLDQRLPEVGLPAEVVTLVRAANDMLDRVEAGFAVQRRFSANAAHELRTPLQLLESGLEKLDSTPATEALREDVGRMSRLVTQLLAVARLDAHTERVGGTADIVKVAVDTLAFLAPLAVARGVSVALDRPPNPVSVQGDPMLLGDMLRNLIENALAYSPAGSEVTVRVHPTGRLDVVDHGPGIEPQYRERVFERFWRAPGAVVGGSGLGLAIVKEIAEACQASIEVGDTPGGGTTISIGLKRIA